MKQYEAVNAYMAALSLNRQRLPAFLSKKIFNLVSLLKPCFDFQVQEEKKIFEAHPNYNPETRSCQAEDLSEEGRHKAQQEVRTVFEELKQLGEIEQDKLDFEPFVIDEATQQEIQITGEEIGYLKPFITFE